MKYEQLGKVGKVNEKNADGEIVGPIQEVQQLEQRHLTSL